MTEDEAWEKLNSQFHECFKAKSESDLVCKIKGEYDERHIKVYEEAINFLEMYPKHLLVPEIVKQMAEAFNLKEDQSEDLRVVALINGSNYCYLNCSIQILR